jgi:hypothetical protein
MSQVLKPILVPELQDVLDRRVIAVGEGYDRSTDVH